MQFSSCRKGYTIIFVVEIFIVDSDTSYYENAIYLEREKRHFLLDHLASSP